MGLACMGLSYPAVDTNQALELWGLACMDLSCPAVGTSQADVKGRREGHPRVDCLHAFRDRKAGLVGEYDE